MIHIKRLISRLPLLVLLCAGWGARPASAGTTLVPITLLPYPEVVGAGPVVVSFGLPLPPGLLTDPTQVAVLDPTGQEVAAHVRSLGNWQSIPPAAMLCSGLPAPAAPGIRSVLVQFSYTF